MAAQAITLPASRGVLELAHAFTVLPSHPKRTVIFLFTTAEERGLLGARYYVQHPLYPLAQTAANINLDYFSNWGWGKTRDFSILGMGMTSLDDLVKDAVTRQGRVVTGDTDPAEGFYWRSDHVEFAMGGVPSLASSPGIDFVGKPADYGDQKRREYISNDYHKPTDQIKPDWDLTGAVEDLQVLLEVGYRVAQSPERPKWRDRGPYMYNPHAAVNRESIVHLSALRWRDFTAAQDQERLIQMMLSQLSNLGVPLNNFPSVAAARCLEMRMPSPDRGICGHVAQDIQHLLLPGYLEEARRLRRIEFHLRRIALVGDAALVFYVQFQMFAGGSTEFPVLRLEDGSSAARSRTLHRVTGGEQIDAKWSWCVARILGQTTNNQLHARAGRVLDRSNQINQTI